jgi:hypothetical protein
MTAGFTELYIEKGADFSSTLYITDDTTNAVVNVSGYIFRSQLRRSHYSANASGNLTCTLTNIANGELTLSMTSDATDNLKAGRHLFDVEMVNTSNNVSRILEGIVTVLPSVTR